jgi:hypothetical protein
MKLLMDMDDDNAHRGWCEPLNLAHFALLDLYNEDKEFSIREDFPFAEFTTKWNHSKASSYIKQLRGSCGGFIESPEVPGEPDMRITFDFSYRSVPDMLRKGEIKEEMENILGSFNSLEAYSHLLFAEMKLLGLGHRDNYFICASVASMRLQSQIGKPPYRFLEAMDSWVGFSIEKPSIRSHLSIHLYHFVMSYERLGWLNMPNLPENVHQERSYDVWSMLYLAIVAGHFEYAKWKIENFPSVLDSAFKKNLIVGLVIGPPHISGASLKDIDYFFEKGLLTEQCDNDLSAIVYIRNLKSFTRQNHTSWQRYLSFKFLLWCGLKALVGSETDFNADRFSHIVMRSLENGASVDFSVTIDNYLKPPDEIEFYFENIETLQFQPEKVRDSTFEKVDAWLEPEGRKKVTLRQWIESIDLKDKSYIIHLLDRADDSRETLRGDIEEVTPEHSLDELGEFGAASDVITSQNYHEVHESPFFSIASQQDMKLLAQWLRHLSGKFKKLSIAVKT